MTEVPGDGVSSLAPGIDEGHSLLQLPFRRELESTIEDRDCPERLDQGGEKMVWELGRANACYSLVFDGQTAVVELVGCCPHFWFLELHEVELFCFRLRFLKSQS